jgi:alkyl hydroperoxide reductase subunit AhpF
MAIISPEDRQSLHRLFAQELQDDVNITYFSQRESVLSIAGQESSPCKETRELLEELTGTSDRLHLAIKDFVRDEQEAQAMGIMRIPAFILQGHARGAVRYFGMPAGYEFSTLVKDLIDVSKGTTTLSGKTRETLATVDQDLHIQVFVTPT